ncbi:MAG: DUF1573 domain-containing protein, partial [Ignavibacteriales bacterium]|nr:DUF1573 domain-containing protein [Ignavibacteriales bacterium]
MRRSTLSLPSFVDLQHFFSLLLLVVMGATALGQNGDYFQGSQHGMKVQGILEPAKGAGVLVAGELWDSYLPPNAYAYYRETNESIRRSLLRIGNFDRLWTTPTHVWPGGWTNGDYWEKGIEIMEFNPDTNWNPTTIADVANPAYFSAAGGNYAFGSYTSSLPGASDATRNYVKETIWVDSTKRHRVVYEAGWPTNIGVDVKVKIHQFSLNWNNFNDFIIVEVAFINTGVVDFNGDGYPEKTSNVIRALTMIAHGEFMCSYRLGSAGSRSANAFGAQRASGYVGNDDPKGSPWDMMIGYPGESLTGTKDMGLNDYPMRFYTDVWSAWSWIVAKQGVAATPDQVHNLPNKTTIWGTPAVSNDSTRGYYTSAGSGKGFIFAPYVGSNPKFYHTAAMGTYYKDGGKSRSSLAFDFSPNPNFFEAGTAGDPTSFIPKSVGARARPNGDQKLLSEEVNGAFEVNTYESNWTKGFTAQNNFDGDMFSGVGPFSLSVGDSMTIVWATVGGFRFRGVANAMAAARWAFENGYPSAILDDYPGVPEMQVEKPLGKSFKIRWDNLADSHRDFAGYKIYRATTASSIDWLMGAMRGLDEYWRNMTPGPTSSNLLMPVNPNFAGQDFVAGKLGTPDSWGPYELIAVIPKNQLSHYLDNNVADYAYAYEDQNIHLEYKYWYYVAAYTDRTANPYDLGTSYAGFSDPTSLTIETSNLNRNGASGLWENTYPFAGGNAYYPTTAEGLKALGAPVSRFSVPATKEISFGDVVFGENKELALLMRNDADDTLTVTSIASSSPVFEVGVSTSKISPGGSITATVRYTPTRVGADSALMLIYSNAPNSPDTVRVSGAGTLTSGVEKLREVPKEYSLSQNYPNPFNPTTTIRYQIPKASYVVLRIYNLLGQVVSTLVEERKEAGYYEAE